MDLSKREIVILGFLAVVAAVGYIFFLQPMATEGARLTKEAKNLSGQARKVHQTLQAIPKGREGLQEAQARLEKIRATLLPNMSSLFSEISRPSKRLGVRIVSFTPTDPDPAKYGQVTCDLIVEGSYLELGKYLEELFNSRYILTVDNLKLRIEEPGDTSIRMHVNLKSWVRQGGAG